MRRIWNETPEAKALRVARIKATWARKKAAKAEAKESKTAKPEAPDQNHATKEVEVSVGRVSGYVELGNGQRLHYPPSQKGSALLALVTAATTALAEVDSIPVREIEESLPSVTECARVKLALEHLVEKSERMLSLVSHCNGLLLSRLDRIEKH
jgi:hypothetical protein